MPRNSASASYAALMMVLASCASHSTGPASADKVDMSSYDVEIGRDVVRGSCASCHAIDQDMISPREGAPPMRTLLERYDSEMLAEDLIEGVRVGHDDMPFFDFDVRSADALIAYLKSIDRRRID